MDREATFWQLGEGNKPDETTVWIGCEQNDQPCDTQPSNHMVMHNVTIKRASHQDAFNKDSPEKSGKRILENTLCDGGRSVNGSAESGHVWAWDLPAGKTKRAQDWTLGRMRQHPPHRPGDADVWRGDNQLRQQWPLIERLRYEHMKMQISQLNQTFYSLHLSVFGDQQYQCINDASWLAHLSTQYEYHIFGERSQANWKRDRRKRTIFCLVDDAERLLSQHHTRADVKTMHWTRVVFHDNEILSTTPTTIYDHSIDFQCEILGELSKDILDSAEEIHRIYQAEAGAGQGKEEEWFYHYSSCAYDIWSSRQIRPSVVKGHAKFGRGVYFTQRTPANNLKELRSNNYDGNSQMTMAKVILHIKVPKKSIENQVVKCTDPKRPHRNIWLLPTEEAIPLPPGSRIGATANDSINQYLTEDLSSFRRPIYKVEQPEKAHQDKLYQHMHPLTVRRPPVIVLIVGAIFVFCGSVVVRFPFDMVKMLVRGMTWFTRRQQSFILYTLMPCTLAVCTGAVFVGIRVSLCIILQMVVLGMAYDTDIPPPKRRRIAPIAIILCVIAYFVGIRIFLEVPLVAAAIGTVYRLGRKIGCSIDLVIFCSLACTIIALLVGMYSFLGVLLEMAFLKLFIR